MVKEEPRGGGGGDVGKNLGGKEGTHNEGNSLCLKVPTVVLVHSWGSTESDHDENPQARRHQKLHSVRSDSVRRLRASAMTSQAVFTVLQWGGHSSHAAPVTACRQGLWGGGEKRERGQGRGGKICTLRQATVYCMLSAASRLGSCSAVPNTCSASCSTYEQHAHIHRDAQKDRLLWERYSMHCTYHGNLVSSPTPSSLVKYYHLNRAVQR